MSNREKKWTYGPWGIEDARGVQWIGQIREHSHKVMRIVVGMEDYSHFHDAAKKRAVANAHLIAAAPELVEALERMIGEFAPMSQNAAAVQARAALAKAYGETK